jgi:HD-GYP domain-containing protein (c-di-GMP phosphodiesterase class II)
MDMQAAMINYDGISAQLIEAVDVSAIKHSEEMLHRTNMRLRRALDGSVGAMAFTLETRDPYTAGHQRRVAELSFAIATGMGLDADVAEGVRIAAAIHDLGKISIPSEILSKPTKLSEIEFSLIKIHSQAGYDILKNIDFPWPIAEIVYQHHEKMDGSGYPRGLRGDDLLVQSRILVVADVVEAMASHRPYRPALGLECALDEIAKNRGRLYDGEVVDACMDLFNNKGFEFK